MDSSTNDASPLSDLYPEELYQLPPRTVVVIPCPWQELSDDDITLLSRILNSVRTTLEAVTILSANTVNLEKIKAMNPRHLLLFGVACEPEADLYQHTTIDTISIIRAEKLSDLTDAKKKHLWTALKEGFQF